MPVSFHGQVMLASLTRGGNLPFRRLCVEFGAQITFSEMVYARQIVRNSSREFALMRFHPCESQFGVQLIAGKEEEAIQAAKIAVERGAVFLDLNAGCPIDQLTRRGLGAALLQRPARLGRLIETLVKGLPVPVTLKIRSGWSRDEINASEVAEVAENSGAAAVILHARTREERYSHAADWALIARLASERKIPIVGNGDLLTHYEARDRWKASQCASIMAGRGALIKPWIFREIIEQKEWLPTAEERIEVYHRLVSHMKEHFGADERGRKRAMYFLPWHFGFFCRYRPLPESRFAEQSRQHPLMQTRLSDEDELCLLDRLLRDGREEIHQLLADALWESASPTDAVGRFQAIAESHPPTPGSGVASPPAEVTE